MKTVLLFSSVFYLLGLKIGNTIEVLKKVVIPVKSVITAPAPRQEKPEKAYYFKAKDAAPAKEKAEKSNHQIQNETRVAISNPNP